MARGVPGLRDIFGAGYYGICSSVAAAVVLGFVFRAVFELSAGAFVVVGDMGGGAADFDYRHSLHCGWRGQAWEFAFGDRRAESGRFPGRLELRANREI